MAGCQTESSPAVERASPLSAQHDSVFGIPLVDLSSDPHRHVVVDRDSSQYLGHPTTALLDDGTVLAVYPEGHGEGPIVYKRSDDGGRTWSDRLPVPESWATSKEVPTLYRIDRPSDRERLILFSGLFPIRRALSDDGGETWSELEAIGDFGGIVAMASLHHQRNGDLLAFFHDDGRFLRGSGEGGAFHVFATRSTDAGSTWSEPWIVAEHPSADLCEPGLVSSPDGARLALLLRENSRSRESFIVFSEDDGVTWSTPRELPKALTGDRHTARYAPDGRLVVTFRDMAEASPTRGDWVAWIGSWDDLVEGGAGAYRVRLMDNQDSWDAAYPGLELLDDGTFLTTTYGHWSEGDPPFVVSIRFQMSELDAALSARGTTPVPADSETPDPGGEVAPQEELDLVTADAVGPVKLSAGMAELESSLGSSVVRASHASIGEGFCAPGSLIFPETDREMEVIWADSSRTTLAHIVITGGGSRWRTPEGVGVGTTLAELEFIAGGPIEFGGFGWDYGGGLAWTEEELDVVLRLTTDPALEAEVANDPRYVEVLGEGMVRSDHPIARRLGITVDRLVVSGAGRADVQYECPTGRGDP